MENNSIRRSPAYKTTFLGLSLLLSSSLARADLLMIDLSGSWPEIQVAREAAKARGERLIVIPEMPDSARVAFAKWKADPRFKASLTSGKREALAVKTQKILEDTLRGLERKGRTLSGLIIQSHSSGQSYFGSIGSLSRDALFSAFEKHPKLRDSIRFIGLWGCYTGTVEGVASFHSQFKAAPVIAGFTGSAPSSQRSVSQTILKDLLLNEDHFSKEMSLKKAAQLANSIPGEMSTTFGALLSGCYVGSQVQAMPIQRLEAFCREGRRLLASPEKKALFQRYWDPTALGVPAGKYDDPPRDTHHSPLRDYYGLVQKYYNCRRHSVPFGLSAQREADPDFPPREKVLKLIFFQNVKSTFLAANAKLIDEVAQQLHKQGAPAELLPNRLQGMTRVELIRYWAKLKLYSDFHHPSSPDAIDSIVEFGGQLRDYLVDLKDASVDFIVP